MLWYFIEFYNYRVKLVVYKKVKKVRKEIPEVLKNGQGLECPFLNNARTSLEKSRCDWHGNNT